MNNTSDKPLNEREKQEAAWDEVRARLFDVTVTIGLPVVLLFITLIVAHWLSTMGIQFILWLNISEYWLEAGLLLGLCAAAALLVWVNYYHRRVYSELFGSNSGGHQSERGWYRNKGKNPGYARVSIERMSGAISWNISGDSLDWSLDAEDPIKEFHPK